MCNIGLKRIRKKWSEISIERGQCPYEAACFTCKNVQRHMPDNRGRARCARYSRKKGGGGENVERSAVILAHVGRTPKGKLRLKSVGIVLGRNSESLVSKVSDSDPRLIFETSYGVRKVAHDVVKKSGQFSRFHDTIVKVVYDDL